MIIFYSKDLDEEFGTLRDDEYRHCVKVLRHQVGDSIHLTNGEGSLAEGVIQQIDKKSVLIKVTQLEMKGPVLPHVELAVCFPKSASRVEFMLEKLVELGVSTISPLISHRSERRKINLERLSKKIISASTQSGHVHFPTIHALVPFQTFIDGLEPSQSVYCHYRNENPQLKDVVGSQRDITIIIGPEGDFNEEELKLMDDKGIQSVNLGHHRLRTETAAVAACAIWRMMSVG